MTALDSLMCGFRRTCVLLLLWCTGCTGNFAAHQGPQPTAGSLTNTAEAAPLVGAGATPLQRLTRAEYANSVRDIFNLAQAPTSTLPSDETSGTFAINTGAVIDSLTLQQYLDSAGTVATAANMNSLLACNPNLSRADCGTQFITTMGRRIMRRPLASDEIATYQKLMSQFGAADVQAGARQVVQTMLISPYFLYKVEIESQDAAATSISAFELATRLSFALWSSTPDDELLDSAASNALLASDELQRQAARMMADARFKSGLRSFVIQWLALTQLPNATKDPLLYPSYNPTLATAMLNETVDFSAWIIQTRNGSMRDLMTLSSAPISPPLFAVYGLPMPAGNQNVQIVALNPRQRAGILTLSAFLTAQAHANQSAPVLRGKTVMTQVLCRDIPPPPANVSTALPVVTSGTTTRERLTAHVTNPACASCHQLFDPVGFGFENFDAIGAWRDTEGGQMVDAGGSYSDSSQATYRFSDPVELANGIATSADLAPCMALQWFRFSLSRNEAPEDASSLAAIQKQFAASDYNLRGLILSIVTSDAFRLHKPQAS